ncbi:hypothetical protein Tther_00767 [Tepidimonas thermarum]|uniref:DUF429 domain-containing protein n=1 Tax=Tepidimonas thermarum TaxID=335431 RepID=A0A554X4U3_9BURK|nr:DUF429 domain-containing protein [Tepidimonas thermarum]TSE30864.1 hypothetical protein Tther_00767 [Tepidimonas thermarum]
MAVTPSGSAALRPRLLGCDFTSAPSRRKPIVQALGRLVGDPGRGQQVVLDGWVRFASLTAWADALAEPGPWVGGFDLPFGLPRPLVQALGWPTDWRACLAHYAALDRTQIRDTFAAYCAARPAGAKFAHRATDGPAGASPSMKWVNPPVAFMLHAGVPRLLDAGVALPGLYQPPGGGDRVALEAYPGLLARSVLGRRPYKSDARAKQTPERLIARKDLLHALESGTAPLLAAAGLRLRVSHAQHDALVADASGDTLDAVLCLLQAVWGLQQHEAGHPLWGLPAFDPLEGWIVTAGEPAAAVTPGGGARRTPGSRGGGPVPPR